jgi:bifunctional N-acetylglucosamine-1-phosphate-uridyltransferase/glucosamine-1-phosphate-acetyltransferase GlmU-like protein
MKAVILAADKGMRMTSGGISFTLATRSFSAS